MKIIKIKNNKTEPKVLQDIVAHLKKGKIIVYPTETFYGIGCDASNARAAAKVFKIKGRADAKALPVIVSSRVMLQKYFALNSLANNLAKKYFPGPLSLVLNFSEFGKKFFKKNINKKSFDGGVRISSNSIATALVKKLGKPLVSTSANPSGQPAARDAQTVVKYFQNKKVQPDIIIDAGKLPPSKGSTFIDVRDGEIRVLRQGDVKIYDLRF